MDGNLFPGTGRHTTMTRPLVRQRRIFSSGGQMRQIRGSSTETATFAQRSWYLWFGSTRLNWVQEFTGFRKRKNTNWLATETTARQRHGRTHIRILFVHVGGLMRVPLQRQLSCRMIPVTLRYLLFPATLYRLQESHAERGWFF